MGNSNTKPPTINRIQDSFKANTQRVNSNLQAIGQQFIRNNPELMGRARELNKNLQARGKQFIENNPNTQRMMEGLKGLKGNLQARGQQFIQQSEKQLAQQGTQQLTPGEITNNDKIINAIDRLTKQLTGGGKYKSNKNNRTKKRNRTKKHRKSKKHKSNKNSRTKKKRTRKNK